MTSQILPTVLIRRIFRLAYITEDVDEDLFQLQQLHHLERSINREFSSFHHLPPTFYALSSLVQLEELTDVLHANPTRAGFVQALRMEIELREWDQSNTFAIEALLRELPSLVSFEGVIDGCKGSRGHGTLAEALTSVIDHMGRIEGLEKMWLRSGHKDAVIPSNSVIRLLQKCPRLRSLELPRIYGGFFPVATSFELPLTRLHHLRCSGYNPRTALLYIHPLIAVSSHSLTSLSIFSAAERHLLDPTLVLEPLISQLIRFEWVHDMNLKHLVPQNYLDLLIPRMINLEHVGLGNAGFTNFEVVLKGLTKLKRVDVYFDRTRKKERVKQLQQYMKQNAVVQNVNITTFGDPDRLIPFV